MVGVATAALAAIATPSYAADLPVYREGSTTYQRETHTYEREYRRAPRVRVAPRVVEKRVLVERPVVEETVVVRRPRPRVVVEEYPVYEEPVYVRPRIYAFAGPRWGHRLWDPRRHFAGGW
jgi:hypothetical protein